MTDAPRRRPMQRLHPASLIFSAGLAAKRLLLPGLLVLVLSRGERYQIWLMLMFVPAVLASAARYISYRYRLGAEELVVRQGIVTRNERHVPYARIQNIDLVQNPLHRWLGVAEVRLETASGEKPEAVMRVLSLAAIEEMRERVFREDAVGGQAPAATAGSLEATGAAEEGAARGRAEPVGIPDRHAAPAAAIERTRPVFAMSPREVVLLGLLSHRGIALIAAAFGVIWQFEAFDVEEWIEQAISRVDALQLADGAAGSTRTALLAVVGLLALLAVLKLLSLSWTAVKFWGFTLRAHGEDLRAEYGLFTRISATIPRRRIQLLSVTQGPLQRWLGRAAVQVETAGRSRGGDERSDVDRLWLAPLIRNERIRDLLETALPEVDLTGVEWQPIAVRAWRRIIKRGLALGGLITLAAGLAVGPWAAAILLPATLLAWLHARLYVKHAGYALLPEAVAYKSGWWQRRRSVVRYGKVQTLELEASPFDRWNRMASLRVDTAGAGLIGHRVDIRYLEAGIAAEMLGRLAHETSRREFRW